jgi:hypothetical protein
MLKSAAHSGFAMPSVTDTFPTFALLRDRPRRGLEVARKDAPVSVVPSALQPAATTPAHHRTRSKSAPSTRWALQAHVHKKWCSAYCTYFACHRARTLHIALRQGSADDQCQILGSSTQSQCDCSPIRSSAHAAGNKRTKVIFAQFARAETPELAAADGQALGLADVLCHARKAIAACKVRVNAGAAVSVCRQACAAGDGLVIIEADLQTARESSRVRDHCMSMHTHHLMVCSM